MKQHALTYHRGGWAIIPVKEGAKTPLIKWADYVSKMPTEADIEKWWTEWPNASIALICGRISGVVVVDVDVKRDGKVPDDPTGLISKTGGGGYHYFYNYPEGEEVPNYVNIRPGVDIRANGGYVILPPSTHASGNNYVWADEPHLVTRGPCPQWVLDGYIKTKGPNKDDGWLSRVLSGDSQAGSRNNDIARLSGYLAKKGLPQDVASSIVMSAVRSQSDPLSQEEVMLTVESVFRTAARRIASGATLESAELVDDTPKNGKTNGFTLTNFRDYMVQYGSTELKWMVKDWIPTNTIAFLASPPGGFKTWLTFDLAISVASGLPFLDSIEVKEPGPVLLVQQEDYHGQIAERLAVISLAKHKILAASVKKDDYAFELPPTDLPIYVHPDRSLRFEEEEVMASFSKVVADIKPRLVIIDPLYSAADSDGYMANSIKHMMQLKKLRDKYGTSFLLVHHTKKSAEDMGRQNMWGSQFLNAFLETGWQVRKLDGDDGKSVVIGRHFKAAAAGATQHVTFDIDTSAKHRYNVKVREATEEEIESASAQKQKTTPLDSYIDGLREHGPCSNAQLALHVGKEKSTVSRDMKKLEKEGRIGKTKDGKRWEVLDLEEF